MATTSGSIPLIIAAGEVPNNSLTLFLKTTSAGATWPEQRYSTWEDTTWTTWVNWGYPPIASGIISDSINLYLLAAISSPYSGNIPLYLEAVTQAEETKVIDLFIKGGTDEETGTLPLFLKNTETGAEGGPAGNTATGIRTLYAAGRAPLLTAAGNIPMFVPVSATGTLTSTIPLFLRNSETATLGTIDLFLKNIAASNAIKCFTQGYWTVFGATNNRGAGVPTPALRAGGNINSASTNNTPTYISVAENCSNPLAVACTMPESVFQETLDTRTHVFNEKSFPGAKPQTGNMPLFLHHDIGISNNMILLTSGVPLIFDNMILLTSGAAELNDNMTLYLNCTSGLLSKTMFLNTIGYLQGV